MIITPEQERMIYSAVRTLRMAEPTEPVEIPKCIWCNQDPVDPAHDPYCSSHCAIQAEADNVD